MKRIVPVVLALLMLSACSSQPDPDVFPKESIPTIITSTVPAETEPVPVSSETVSIPDHTETAVTTEIETAARIPEISYSSDITIDTTIPQETTETSQLFTTAETEFHDFVLPEGFSPYTHRPVIEHIYLYDHLSDADKELYDLLYNAADSLDPIIEFPADNRPDEDRLLNIFNIFCNNEYKLFYVDKFFDYTGQNEEVYAMSLRFIADKPDIVRMREQIQTETARMLSCLDPQMSEYEICLKIHDEIIEHCTYEETGDFVRDIYGCMIMGKANCQGYSRTFAYLCSLAGIESFMVEDDDVTQHMWNEVKVAGEYYHIDTTWDDPDRTLVVDFIKYDYFMVGDSDILRTRAINDGFVKNSTVQHPSCPDSNYDWFDLYDMNVESCKDAENLIVKKYDPSSGLNIIQMKAPDQATYDEIMDTLIYSGVVLFLVPDDDNIRIDYAANDDMYVIRFFFIDTRIYTPRD